MVYVYREPEELPDAQSWLIAEHCEELVDMLEELGIFGETMIADHPHLGYVACVALHKATEAKTLGAGERGHDELL